MKRWKWVALLFSLVVAAVGFFFAYRSIVKYRDLQETMLWVVQTYNPHRGSARFGGGYGSEIRRLNGEITERVTMTLTYDGNCNMSVHDDSVSFGTRFIDTYKLNLRDIDPDSIKVKTFDFYTGTGNPDIFNCDDPEKVKRFDLVCTSAEIEFPARNDAMVIDEETMKPSTGQDNEFRDIKKTSRVWIVVDDVPYAQKLAKALKHGVELCGGKASKF